jgi:TonB family protein
MVLNQPPAVVRYVLALTNRHAGLPHTSLIPCRASLYTESMSGVPRDGRCIYCLGLFPKVQMTTGCVPAKSWYWKPMPSTVQAWEAPCCRGCNNDLSRVESDLLIRLGLCINPFTDEVAEVASTARPALGLDAANLPGKEKGRRGLIRAKVRADLMAYGEVAETAVSISGLVLQPGNVSESPVLSIPYSDLSKIAEKFGRGCEYKLRNRYVELPYGLRNFISHPDEIRAEFDGEQLFDFGPEFKIKCVRNAENPGNVAYWFLLWDTVCLKVFIALESVLVALEPQFSRPPVEVAETRTMARTDSPQQQSVSARVSMPDWKHCEGEIADSAPQPPVSAWPAAATAKPVTRKVRRWYYVAGFTLIVAASAVVGLLVKPRATAPVVLTSEPVRPLPTSASPGTTPSGSEPAESAPLVTPTGQTQMQNVAVAAQDEIASRVVPDIPAKARNTIHGTVMVFVQVTVDSAGSVAEATLEPGGSQYFGKLAIEAARHWRFAPAKGMPPRTWILRFEITRTSTQVIPRPAKN